MLSELFLPVVSEESHSNLNIRVASVYDDKELSWADVFMFGFGEDRNSDNNGAGQAADVIRRILYSLHDTSLPLHCIDLGNCRQGYSVAESYENLATAMQELSAYDKPVVIYGGTQEAVAYLTKTGFGKIAYPALSLVDAQIDVNVENEDFSNKQYLQRIVAEYPNVRLIHIASQEYLSSRESFSWWKSHNFTCKRLGECSQSDRVEPLLRDAQVVSFDMNAFRYSDNPAGRNVNGLYSEIACQFAWNSGYSPRMNVFFLSEFNPTKDVDGISAQLAAQIVWHVLDGISQRKHETGDFSDVSYEKFHLRHSMFPKNICFYRSTVSQTLWVEVPIGSTGKNRIIPCSQFDFDQFCSGVIPTDWMVEFQRLSE